ncbi:hypothetical protein N8B89_06025 [Enterococcus faecium]
MKKVDKWFPSSQICSECAHKEGKKSLEMREGTCPVSIPLLSIPLRIIFLPSKPLSGGKPNQKKKKPKKKHVSLHPLGDQKHSRFLHKSGYFGINK